MAKLHDPAKLAAAERAARRRTPQPTPDPGPVEPHLDGVRADLIERGLAVSTEQLRLVLQVLHIDDHASVAAVLIDRHEVTVVRKRTVPQRGGSTHVRVSKERLPILRDAAELDQLRSEHP